MGEMPQWLWKYRLNATPAFTPSGYIYSTRRHRADFEDKNNGDQGAIRHETNDGTHVSPFDNATVLVGNDKLIVNLVQGIDEEKFKTALQRATYATTGLAPDTELSGDEWEDMLSGGLQHAMESQTIIFEVFGASRALTHQLVRSRKAGFHQQSQRATWFGDHPDVRIPENVWNNHGVRDLWIQAVRASWAAYGAACDAGIAYEHARYILPEGTVNYIMCEYTVREFLNVYAYRGCSMFLSEMHQVMRKMRELLVEAHPFLEPHVKISCEKTGPGVMSTATGNPNDVRQLPHKCTFQGWENVEERCTFPWAKQHNRTFLPHPRLRIGG